MLLTLRRSRNILTRKRKIGLSLLSLVRVATNLIDVLAVTLIGVASAVLLGSTFTIPAINIVPAAIQASPELLPALTAVLLLSKTTVGVPLSWQDNTLSRPSRIASLQPNCAIVVLGGPPEGPKSFQ